MKKHESWYEKVKREACVIHKDRLRKDADAKTSKTCDAKTFKTCDQGKKVGLEKKVRLREPGGVRGTEESMR